MIDQNVIVAKNPPLVVADEAHPLVVAQRGDEVP
jgi:hypothetical protein